MYRVYLICRNILCFVFILSSVFKSINIKSTISEVSAYIVLYMPSFFQKYTVECALLVCMIELLLAIVALNMQYRRITNISFFFLILFFVYLTGQNLFFPTIMGSIESCGCFGELIHFSPLASFVKSVVLWIMSIVFVAYSWHERWNVSMLLKDWYLYVCIVTSLVLPLYSLWFFEVLSHTVYIIGFVVLVVMLTGNIIIWRGIGQNETRGITDGGLM